MNSGIPAATAIGKNNQIGAGLFNVLYVVAEAMKKAKKGHAPGMVSKKADYKEDVGTQTYVRDEGPGVKTPRKNSAEARLGRRARGTKRLSSKEAPGTKPITDSLNTAPAGGIQL